MDFRHLQSCQGFDHALTQFCVGQSADDMEAVAREGVNDFLRRRLKYLLYD